MRRCGAVLAFLAAAAAVFFFLLRYGEQQERLHRDIQEPMEAIQIYTDLPQGAVQIFDEPFAEIHGMRLAVQEMTGAQMVQAAEAGRKPDLYLASQRALEALKAAGHLAVHVSEQTDTVLNARKDADGFWTGIWINPAVFAVNVDFAATHPAFFYTWDEVFSRQSVRLIMTDFIAAEYSEDSLMSLVEHFGREGTFARLHEAAGHIVQYGKYLSTPAHMAAMDKCDIGISGLDEAEKVRQEGMPVRIIYPEDGTFYYLYGAAVARGGTHAEAAASFMDWLLDSEERGALLREHGYYFLYVNDSRRKEDDARQKIEFWPLNKQYTEEGKKELLDQWLQEIRFGKD